MLFDWFQMSSSTTVIVNASLGGMAPATGTRSYYMYTIDRNGYIKKYINGAYISRLDISAYASQNINTNGTDNRIGGYHYSGMMDEIRIYNRALST